MSHVLLAMSGGVDSSVAASILLERGHRLSGVYMRHKLQCNPGEEADAVRTAEQLGIELHRLNIDEPFREIVEHFTDFYLSGKTPNPCALCNRKIKFGRLIDFADSLGCEQFATGHYARITPEGALCRAKDLSKDQSYILYGIERNRLSRIISPLGELTKAEVRERAARLGLHVSGKKDSQEICFVPPHRHVEFLRERCPGIETAGHFVSTSGEILGRHDGFERFTVGQRKGMKVGFGERVFVVRIDTATKNVVIGSREDLAVRELRANETNWLADVPEREPFRCEVKIRYRNEPTAATVRLEADGQMQVRFDEPKYGVAPGQIAVCYSGGQVLGGGTIIEGSQKEPQV